MDLIGQLLLNSAAQKAATYREPQVISCTVADLFNAASQPLAPGITAPLTIPPYQRPYVWGQTEVNKLLTDLHEYFDIDDTTRPMYYLGSIILHYNGKCLNIIDGQQRLTTMAIIQSIITGKAPMLEYDSPVSINNILRNYKTLQQSLSGDSGSKINLQQLNVTVVVTYSEDEAYTFFETQNTGGVRLSGVDIIKAHHLREISVENKQQDTYAKTWETLPHLPVIVERLLKARRWAVLNWVNVPAYYDTAGLKAAIINDFSESTLPVTEKAAYPHVQLAADYATQRLGPQPFAIRQPLANGENFIDYIQALGSFYTRLFVAASDKEIKNEFYVFRNEVLEKTDGTAYLKEFYETALLCYVSRFGLTHLSEASLWIFRYCYSKRLSNPKIVKESSVPAFIQEGNYLFDQILTAFTHTELMACLKHFNYEVHPDNTKSNTTKTRFVKTAQNYFAPNENWEPKDFDNLLTRAITKKVAEE